MSVWINAALKQFNINGIMSVLSSPFKAINTLTPHTLAKQVIHRTKGFPIVAINLCFSSDLLETSAKGFGNPSNHSERLSDFSKYFLIKYNICPSSVTVLQPKQKNTVQNNVNMVSRFLGFGFRNLHSHRNTYCKPLRLSD